MAGTLKFYSNRRDLDIKLLFEIKINTPIIMSYTSERFEMHEIERIRHTLCLELINGQMIKIEEANDIIVVYYPATICYNDPICLLKHGDIIELSTLIGLDLDIKIERDSLSYPYILDRDTLKIKPKYRDGGILCKGIASGNLEILCDSKDE